MGPTQSYQTAIPPTIAAAVVLVASFLPWGTFRGTPALPFGGTPFAGLELSFTASAWNGSIAPLGLSLPNWLVVVAAVAVAALAWLEAAGTWTPPGTLPLGLAGYGFLHATWWIAVIALSGKASVGIGSLATGIAFTSMLVAFVRRRRDQLAGGAKGGNLADDAPG